MHAKPYPETKRRQLINQSVEEFVSFLEEVTDSEGREFIRTQLLPQTVTGFRPGNAPLTLTVPKLISNLSDEQELTNPDSLIWDKFKNAWICWVSSHQKLNNILLEFNNDSDFDDNQQSIVPPNSELDRQCFDVLLEASCNDQIDRETIRRFYEYGHFDQCDQIEHLIDEAHTREEIGRRQQIEQLPDQVNKLQQEINELRTQFSNLDTMSELQQLLDQQIEQVQRSFEEQLSQLDFSQNVNRLSQSVGSLTSRLDVLENSQNETESGINDFVDHTEVITTQIEQQLQENNQSVTEQLERMNRVVAEMTVHIEQQRQSINQSIGERIDSIDSAIVEIRSEVEAQNQPSNRPLNVPETSELENREAGAPRIAHQAVEIGRSAAAKLEERAKHYEDEEDYLSDFAYCLRRHGITDSGEIAAAIHVALKAFPVLQITDKRIFKVWNLMCDEHLYYTNLYVEMGWLGLQDWFPKLLAEECFGEQLERNDLKVSIQKMLELGNMLWAIHFRNCDRSFPESYLPSFLQWTKDISDSTIKVFLSRTSGNNRCEITEDAYALIARLPVPEEEEPIEAENLRSSRIIVTHSEWDAWCQPLPNVDQHLQDQVNFVSEIRTTISENGGRIPKTPLREILHYLRLSQSIEMAPTRALDWGLTMRILPWIENQPEIIEQVLIMLDQEYVGLEHFQQGLQQLRENR